MFQKFGIIRSTSLKGMASPIQPVSFSTDTRVIKRSASTAMITGLKKLFGLSSNRPNGKWHTGSMVDIVLNWQCPLAATSANPVLHFDNYAD